MRLPAARVLSIPWGLTGYPFRLTRTVTISLKLRDSSG